MKTSRQEYHDSTLTEALASGCDIVQPKLRGLWVRIEVARGLVNLFHHDDTLHSTHDTPNDDILCTLVGDFLNPSQIVVWDCWMIGSNADVRPSREDVTMLHYRDRFAFAKQQVTLLGALFTLVKNYPISRAHELWSHDELSWCGLILRCSRDPVGLPLRVVRKYKEAPRELV